MRFVILSVLLFSLPAFANEGPKAPDALMAKWSEVKTEAIEKYEKAKNSDLGVKAQKKAVEAKNSPYVQGLFAKAKDFWKRALVRGKGLLVKADQKLHEKILDEHTAGSKPNVD